MTDLVEIFKQLEAHAREWLDFSLETYGWNTREYGEFVRCYFADAGNHRAVTLGRYGCQIDVNFHNPVQFGDMTLAALKSAETILAESRALLAAEREQAANRTESEVQAEREAQIAALRQRLAELEGGVAA